MKSWLHRLARFVSGPRGAKIVLIVWVVAIVALSGIAPGAKKFAVSTGEGSIHADTPSAVAQALLDEQFPSKDGAPALLVFHGNGPITDDERAKIAAVSEWLASDKKPENMAAAVPFHQLPRPVQDKLFSEDRTTLLLNVALTKGLESDRIYDTLQQIQRHVDETGIGDLQFEITGPAGIAADTITLFKNADFVLMFATVGLILVILIVIYRSPLLAVIPLLIAGVVYQAVDRLLGLAAKNGWFLVDKQALSIMMILLFAVLTDYCLFVVSRYREELKKLGSKNDAMTIAMSQVAEPILFSGGTVLIAMLTLFAAVFQPYHHFAPVFGIAMVVILLGGLTLIPAVFALIGRKAFWPMVPKVGDVTAKRKSFWTRVGGFVTKKSAVTAIVLIVILGAASLNVGTMKSSFNLMKSFPDDISSRQGFELLEQHYPQGKLAPVIVLLESDQKIEPNDAFFAKMNALTAALKKRDGIDSAAPDIWGAELLQTSPGSVVSESRKALKLQLTLQGNPYDPASLDLVNALRNDSAELLKTSGFDPSQFSMHIAGQSAEQLDVRDMNERDTVLVFALIAAFIAIMLAFQARSIVLAIIMMGTMLLSYAATLGFGWFLFHDVMGFDSISYRLPMYTFVFLIALGVDYNIILVSRIREESKRFEWKEAISRGVSLTGGVISSAGIILAATFGVLITQPLQELYLFGMVMAIGILVDTFLVRGMLLPAIMSLIGRRERTMNQGKSSTNL